MAFYDLIFQGQMIDSASLDSSSLQQRKNNIVRLFNADAEKASRLFSGKPIVIKKDITKETAEKYVSVLKKAGALIHAVEIQVIGQKNYTTDNSSSEERLSNKNQINTASPVSATPSDDSSSSSSLGLSAGLSALLNYNQHVQQTASESGTVLSSTNDSADAEQELNLAPIGTDFSDLKKNIEAVKIADIGHISLAESHTGSLQEFTEKATPVKIPDISSLSMSEAQQGTLEGIENKQDPVELPDISHLKYSSDSIA